MQRFLNNLLGLSLQVKAFLEDFLTIDIVYADTMVICPFLFLTYLFYLKDRQTEGERGKQTFHQLAYSPMATLATAQPVASSHLPCGCRSPGQPSLLSQAAESEAEQPGLELEPTCNAGTTGLESASPWSSAFTQRLVNSFPALLAKCQTYMYKHAYVYI